MDNDPQPKSLSSVSGIAKLGLLLLGMFLVLILLVVGFALRPAIMDGNDSDLETRNSGSAVLASDVDRLQSLFDSQLVFFGVAVAIMGVAATGLVAINVLGLISANRSYERDRDALETRLDLRLQYAKKDADGNIDDAKRFFREQLLDERERQASIQASYRSETEALANKIDNVETIIKARLTQVEVDALIAQADSYKQDGFYEISLIYYQIALDTAIKGNAAEWSFTTLLTHIPKGFGKIAMNAIASDEEAMKIVLNIESKVLGLKLPLNVGVGLFLEFVKTIRNLAGKAVVSKD